MWYAEGRGPRRDGDRPYPVPDLAIEVRSASTWRYDIGAKKAAYERGGLPELWLVDTAADEVLVFRRSAPTAATFDVSLELTVADSSPRRCCPGPPSPCDGCSMHSARHEGPATAHGPFTAIGRTSKRCVEVHGLWRDGNLVCTSAAGRDVRSRMRNTPRASA